jgi:hypothetical protein
MFTIKETNCFDNVIAERVKTILEDQFYLSQTFYKVALAKKTINLYNKIKITFIFRL